MSAQKQTNGPDMIYNQPKPFQRRRLFLQLLTVLAVVLAIFLGMSVFFNIQTVMVSGAEKYSADTVYEASGIEKGDSLLFFGKARTASLLQKELPYIQRVYFRIELPATVHIIVEEIPAVYAIKARGGNWWLMSAEGKLTEQIDTAAANGYTKIQGVEITDPKAGELAKAAELSSEPADGTPVTVTQADRLKTALDIVTQLEANEIMGPVTSLDVSRLQELEMWYGSRYQVKLGDQTRLDYKIAAIKQVVAQLGDQRTGVLDASFTTYPDKVWHSPFAE